MYIADKKRQTQGTLVKGFSDCLLAVVVGSH